MYSWILKDPLMFGSFNMILLTGIRFGTDFGSVTSVSWSTDSRHIAASSPLLGGGFSGGTLELKPWSFEVVSPQNVITNPLPYIQFSLP